MERTNREAQRRSFGFSSVNVSAWRYWSKLGLEGKVAKNLEGGSSRPIAWAFEKSKRNAIWVDEHCHLVTTW
jgi:hypothetical protein